jgi:hypothetical protein
MYHLKCVLHPFVIFRKVELELASITCSGQGTRTSSHEVSIQENTDRSSTAVACVASRESCCSWPKAPLESWLDQNEWRLQRYHRRLRQEQRRVEARLLLDGTELSIASRGYFSRVDLLSWACLTPGSSWLG